MKTEIVVALIGAVASIGAAVITSIEIVDNRIEEIAVVSAGQVSQEGNRELWKGGNFSVDFQSPGTYRISFNQPFDTNPIVLATSDGGDRGAVAEVSDVSASGFTVEGRTYDSHQLAQIGFQFVAVESVE